MDSQKDVVNIRPSFIGGLNKVDVTEYIQKLQDQILKLDEESDLQRQEIEELRKSLKDAEVCYRALWNNCESQKETIQYQKELIEQLKRYSEETKLEKKADSPKSEKKADSPKPEKKADSPKPEKGKKSKKKTKKKK